MGGARFSTTAYASYATTNLRNADGSRKSISDTFRNREIQQDFNPVNITIRESRDSEQNPESRAIILGLDVSGSMGMIAHEMANEGIPALMTSVIDLHTVTDPHIMCLAIGDHRQYDRSPIQATQFEADNRIVEQLQGLYLEGGGGGNDCESYDLAWYFAGRYTDIDCFDKRGVKGLLFTIGDEPPAPDTQPTTPAQFKALFKDGDAKSMTPSEMLAMAQERYDVFHIIVEQGNYPRSRGLAAVEKPWRELLGKRVILLNDYTQLSPVIRAVIAVNEGADPDEVIEQTEGEKAQAAVRHALFGGTGQ